MDLPHTCHHLKVGSLIERITRDAWRSSGLRLGAFIAKSLGSIPGCGTKIPQATQHGQLKINEQIGPKTNKQKSYSTTVLVLLDVICALNQRPLYGVLSPIAKIFIPGSRK